MIDYVKHAGEEIPEKTGLTELKKKHVRYFHYTGKKDGDFEIY